MANAFLCTQHWLLLTLMTLNDAQSVFVCINLTAAHHLLDLRVTHALRIQLRSPEATQSAIPLLHVLEASSVRTNRLMRRVPRSPHVVRSADYAMSLAVVVTRHVEATSAATLAMICINNVYDAIP